jgi:hypothetical protein
VPTGITSVTFDAYGARGGNVLANVGGQVQVVTTGGAGGEAKGKFAVHTGEKFEIVVGGQGGNSTVGGAPGAGGFNGGGDGAPAGEVPATAGGGGASDVRLPGRGGTCAASKKCWLGDRIIVGGGGGGGGNATSLDGYAGGGLEGAGGTCQHPNADGDQSGAQSCAGIPVRPGCTGVGAGSFGVGGGGCSSGGGGGGGWWGGAGESFAGGGSGYISSFSKAGTFPGGTQQGDGKVIITT